MLGRAGRGQQLRQIARGALGEGLGQVFQNGTRFGQHQLAVAQHRRLAQRVHRLELGRRQPVAALAGIGFELVGQAHFLQQPEHTLRARLLQVVQHQRLGVGVGWRCVWGCAGGGGKGVHGRLWLKG